MDSEGAKRTLKKKTFLSYQQLSGEESNVKFTRSFYLEIHVAGINAYPILRQLYKSVSKRPN